MHHGNGSRRRCLCIVLLTWTTIFVNTIMVASRAQDRALFAVANKTDKTRKTENLDMPVSARKSARLSAVARSALARPATQRRKNPERTIDLGALNRHLGYFIRRAQVWVFQDIIRSLKTLDISPAQYSVLLVIDTNPGLSQAELSRTLGIQRARMVRVLHRLDRRGLTRRLQSSDDGRTNALRLTPKGQETLRRAQFLAEQHEARLSDRLGADSYKTMRNVLQNFQAMQ
jgi:DNA-binding MarR family transcriptional regulator